MENQFKKILEIVNKFRNVRVLIVGDLMLDEYILGTVDRISPEAPVPILDVKKITYSLGGAANVAYNIKALKGKVILTGVVGRDDQGKLFRKIVKERGIRTREIIIDPKRMTTLKSRVIATNQQITRIDLEDRKSIDSTIEKQIINFVAKKIKDIDIILISDYAKGVVTFKLSQNIIKLAQDNHIFCLVDPKGHDYLKYQGCNIITPNEGELAQVLKIQIENENKFLWAGRALLSKLKCDQVLVTRGVKGMTLFGKNGTLEHCPAVNTQGKALDVSGAGDTAIAVVALSLMAGATLKQAMMMANHACGIVVAKRGTAMVLPTELTESLKKVF